jgi:hypothetical protein
MGSVLVPPSVTEVEHEREPVVDPEALIEEARQRQQRRRRGIAGALVVAIVLGALAFGVVRLVSSGGTKVGESSPKRLFVSRSAFAGHGLLAFVSRGRLFVLDGKTQQLTAVTSAAAQVSDPRFSPDGRWLTYAIGPGRFGLARADGAAARTIALRGGGEWLPNGDLLSDNGVYRVSADGSLVRVGSTPKGLVAWSPNGDRFAFVSRQIVHQPNGAFQGVETLQVADSLTGKRTTWRGVPFSFTRKLGFQGSVTANVRVLPNGEGILFWIDPDQSNSYAADGLSVYEVRGPAGKAIRLAVTLGDTVSIGPGGKLAIGAGGNRYAWITKYVVTCNAATARCTKAPTPSGRLTINPAWSPNGKMLAYVEAAARPAGDFRQATIERWYATHRLWLLRSGATRATEVAGTQGAAAPVWSDDSGSVLYVAGDALWLVPKIGARPEKIAGPLYPPNAWPSYYGEIGWSSQFAWTSS